jgi:fibronectin-binding autotransporter adhesin
MPAPVLQIKRGNAGVAGTVPALRPGEPAISLNNFDLFIGIDTSVANNKFFGSHRYWKREDGTTSLRLNLVDKTGIGGTIQLKTPDSHTGVTTYTFPSTPVPGNFLKVDANGTLSWDSVTSSGSFSNSSFSGITTITGSLNNQANTSNSGITTFTNTTDNTLGNSNTGSVQIDGGLGVDKNVTIGANLNVQGYSEFVGVVTFRSGTVVLGDQPSDQITVGGQFNSSLIPSSDNSYDLGIGTQRWRNGSFSGIVTANSFVGSITGTATTATRATTVDVSTAPSGVYYPTLVNISGSGTTSLYTDIGLYYVAQSDTLYINGNVSIGGTSGVLFATNLFVSDKDIIVGYTTDLNGNDTSKDTTSSHGGIAVASTTGSPLFNMPQVTGVNSMPFTYKQFMWIAQGTSGYTGMGTDSWVSNYPIAIGTATVANNSRFTVGAGFTVYDTVLVATDITARHLNITGVTTLGITSTTNLTSQQLNVSGFSTFSGITTHTASLFGTQASFTGVVTATSFSGSLTGNASSATYATNAGVATKATLVDTTTASAGTFYPALMVNSTGTASTAVYVDSGISYVSNTDTLTLTGNLAVNGATVTTTGTAATIFNTNATTVNAFGAATALVMGATSGIATINNPTLVGTQASQDLYNTVATNLNFGGAATALVMGATSGIATIRNTTVTLPNATTVNVNGVNPTLAGSSTGTLTLFNTNLTGVNAFGAATNLTLGASTGVATISNATLTLPNATTVNVNGTNPTLASSSTGTLTLFNSNLTSVNAFGAATNIVVGNTTGITTFRNSIRVTNNLYDSGNSAGSSGQFLTVTGAGIGWTTISGVTAGAISTSTRAQTIDSTSTLDTGTFFPALFPSSSAGTGITVYVDSGISFDASANTLTVGGNLAVNGGNVTTTASTANIVNANATTVNIANAATALVMSAATGITTVRNKLTVGGNLEVDGNTIQSSTGANAITLSGNDVTVVGNLYVNGNTTQVNTTALTVEDRTIELGKVDGAATNTTTWDLGVLFNYGDAGTPRKSAVIWEHGDSRFKFAKILDADTDGTSSSTPQLTITGAANYAAIEINALWINDCAGQSQVISCTGSERFLENITVDAGTF